MIIGVCPYAPSVIEFCLVILQVWFACFNFYMILVSFANTLHYISVFSSALSLSLSFSLSLSLSPFFPSPSFSSPLLFLFFMQCCRPEDNTRCQILCCVRQVWLVLQRRKDSCDPVYGQTRAENRLWRWLREGVCVRVRVCVCVCMCVCVCVCVRGWVCGGVSINKGVGYTQKYVCFFIWLRWFYFHLH